MLVHPLDNIVLQEALLQFPLLSMSIRLISIKHLPELFDFLLFLLLELLLIGTDALQFFRSLMVLHHQVGILPVCKHLVRLLLPVIPINPHSSQRQHNKPHA